MSDIGVTAAEPTLSVEQISTLETQHAALVRTARAGATLAGMVRGAVRGCDERTSKMLTIFLELAGFEP